MEEKLRELFPDETITLQHYRSFVNQPERIQISSQEDMNDYDPNTLTTYYNFRVRLPRPALNVKSIQLARASIPNAVPNFPDTELVWWYYALPNVSPGVIRDPNTLDVVYTFDTSGNLYNPPGNVRIRSGKIYLNQNDALPTYVTDQAGVVFPYGGGGAIAGASINYTTGVFIFDGVSYSYDTVAAEDTPFYEPPNPVPMQSGPNIGFYFALDANNIFFAQGVLAIAKDQFSPYTYDAVAAAVGPPFTPVPATYDDDPNPPITQYFIEYSGPKVRASPRYSYLRYCRLMPSYAQPELMNTFVGGFNRTFIDYDDIVAEVNNATVDDPLNGQPGNDRLGSFRFVADQIAFSYEPRFNKIVFTGLDSAFAYLPAAADDPILPLAASQLQARDRDNIRFQFSGAIQIIQPYWPYRDLNLRLGFTYATYPSGDNFDNMIRPIPPFDPEPAPPFPPLSLGNFTSYDHVAPGYPDLVYSSCCHLYTDITGGSTVDSIANRALLASVPINAPNLGVGFHSLPLNNPLTKIVEQIYEIYIEMRTDTGAPFILGNNAIVSLELILTY